MGGLSKKQTLLTRLQKKGKTSLLVDAGALLFAKYYLPDGYRGEQAKINATAVAEAYDLMGYEAVGISRMDLSGGISFLQHIADKTSFPWLSANLVDGAGRALFPPSAIIRKEQLDIGLIGLTEEDANMAIPGDGDAKVLPWQECLPQLVEKLAGEVDLLILLSSEKPEVNKKIALAFPSIHILIQAGRGAHNVNPQPLNNTLICQTDKQGKYLGEMDITWTDSRTWQINDSDRHEILKKELDRLNWQIKRLSAKGDPEVVFKDRPATLKAFRKIIERQTVLLEEIAATENNGTKQPQNATYENIFHGIWVNIADDPRIAGILAESKKRVNALGREQGKSQPVRASIYYSGSDKCIQCHGDEGRSWGATAHAKAYQTLVDKEQQYNSACLSCHMTGHSPDDRVQAIAFPTLLRNVGCETCHGPGRKHVAAPEKWKLLVKPPPSLCLQCHVEEHDDGFDYGQDIMKVHLNP